MADVRILRAAGAAPPNDSLAAAERAYRSLRNQIMSGTLPGGARLSEAQMADSLGVSRTPVREALSRLHTEGLVHFERYRGARVADLTEEDLAEVFELRFLLEGMAAARAAVRMTPQIIELLEDNLRRTEDLINDRGESAIEGFVDANREFHSIILDAAKSKRLKAIITPLIDMPTHGRPAHVGDPSFIANALAHHRQVVDALRSGDSEWARSQMQAHLAQARMLGRRPLLTRT